MVVSASLGAIACAANKAVAQAGAGSAGHAHHGSSGAVVSAAHGCLQAGDVCVAHCLKLLASGDTSMGPCSMAAREMVAAMQTVAVYAADGSKLLGAAAKLAIEACRVCADECKKHADKHADCKACLDSCTHCIGVLQGVAS